MELTILRNRYSLHLNKRIVTILLIIFQGCGIDFPKKGVILIFIIVFLSRKGFKYFSYSSFKHLLFIFLFLIYNKLFNSAFDLSKLLFVSALIFESYIFLLSYKKIGVSVLADDFYNALNLIFFHAFVGYILYLFLPFLFTYSKPSNYPYYTLLNIFYVTGDIGSTMRNTGLLWEPGLLQLMLNIFLFFSIKRAAPNLFLLLICLAIFSCFSTSGYFCLILNYFYFLRFNLNKDKKLVSYVLFFSVLFSSVLLFIWKDIADKMGGENLSGLARYRDLYIGIELIKEKPFFGHGIFEEAYLYTKDYVSQIQNNLFSEQTLNIIGNVAGGYVNGFLEIFIWFGIPAAILVYHYFYRNVFAGNHVHEKIIFFCIMCFTFIAEPITYTSFFFIFPLSAMMYSKQNEMQLKELSI